MAIRSDVGHRGARRRVVLAQTQSQARQHKCGDELVAGEWPTRHGAHLAWAWPTQSMPWAELGSLARHEAQCSGSMEPYASEKGAIKKGD